MIAGPAAAAPSPVDSWGRPIERVSASLSRYEKLDLRHHRFDDMNANKATFVDCDFSYSIFERAYFRSAEFHKCKFTGCRFYDCNLRGASFPGSEFKYASFHRTMLETKEMIAVLPLEPNLRRDDAEEMAEFE